LRRTYLLSVPVSISSVLPPQFCVVLHSKSALVFSEKVRLVLHEGAGPAHELQQAFSFYGWGYIATNRRRHSASNGRLVLGALLIGAGLPFLIAGIAMLG
jgi:hypothetical protein